MMAKNKAWLFFLLFAFTFFSVKSETLQKKKEADILKLVRERMTVFPDQTQIAMAYVKDGEVFYSGFLKEGGKYKAKDNHAQVFEIGSITKVFTSVILAGFVQDGNFELNDKVNKYSKLAWKDNVEISFQELANHTSGLPRLPSNISGSFSKDPANPYKNYNEQFLREYISDQMILQEKKYEYSNLGAGLLGFIMCKFSGEDYEQLLHKRVAEKYKMPNTTIRRGKVESLLVKGLDAQGNETSNWDFDVLAGAGAALSSVDDMSRFILAQFSDTDKELLLTHKSTFTVNEHMDMGLGWHISANDAEKKWHWHNGGTGGYTSCMVVDIPNKSGVVVLTNISAFHPNMSLVNDLCFEFMNGLSEE